MTESDIPEDKHLDKRPIDVFVEILAKDLAKVGRTANRIHEILLDNPKIMDHPEAAYHLGMAQAYIERAFEECSQAHLINTFGRAIKDLNHPRVKP